MLMKGSRLPALQAEVFSNDSIESSSTGFPRHLIAFTISEQTGFCPRGKRGVQQLWSSLSSQPDMKKSNCCQSRSELELDTSLLALPWGAMESIKWSDSSKTEFNELLWKTTHYWRKRKHSCYLRTTSSRTITHPFLFLPVPQSLFLIQYNSCNIV